MPLPASVKGDGREKRAGAAGCMQWMAKECQRCGQMLCMKQKKGTVRSLGDCCEQ